MLALRLQSALIKRNGKEMKEGKILLGVETELGKGGVCEEEFNPDGGKCCRLINICLSWEAGHLQKKSTVINFTKRKGDTGTKLCSWRPQEVRGCAV